MNKKTPPSAESCSSSESASSRSVSSGSAFSGSASIHHERSPFERSVLEVASRAGSILVESGAEISRVEETIERICRHYGVQSEHAYVLSNGIFLAAGSRSEKSYASVRYIPVKGTRFDRVSAVNQFSREVVAGKYTVEEAEKELDRIEHLPGKPGLAQILASGAGAAAFCVLFGGNGTDALCAFLAGILLWVFILRAVAAGKSKMVTNIIGGMLVTTICYILKYFDVGQNLHEMIIGSVMPMIPGAAFINGIRDITDEDYLSGFVRMLDALLVFVSISIGVAVVTVLAYSLTGGALL